MEEITALENLKTGETAPDCNAKVVKVKRVWTVRDFNLSQLYCAEGVKRNFSLTISPADESDAGIYSCVANNTGGQTD